VLYRVLQPMTLHPGALLGLTAEQAAARSYGLVQQGVQWRVVKPVSFKAGEHLVHEGELPKMLAQAVAPVTTPDDQGATPAPAAQQTAARAPRAPRKPARSAA
jgi:hypothetical protein